MSDTPLAAFGYRPERTSPADRFQVSEGKDGDTLEPVVVLAVHHTGGLAPVWRRYAIGPDLADALADALADQLHHFATVARVRHWTATSDPQ